MSATPDIRAGRLAPAKLADNFADIHPPLDATAARIEASRCYFCHDAPCIEACPTGIDIPGFIRKIASANLAGAAMDILDENIFGGACARVCPTEELCERACVREAQDGKPVKIGPLQRHAVDALVAGGGQPYSRAAPSGRRIAIVGAGPAGLACAHALARRGHDCVVFEARDKPAGLNEYGIAAYKVPDDFAQAEIAFILALGGIELRCGQALGRELVLDALRADYDAVFLGLGLGGTRRLALDGEDEPGVEDAIAYIERLRQCRNLSDFAVGRRIVVIGGGNTAIDIAAQTRRLGAEDVTMVYRRGPDEMTATGREQAFAKTDGVKIKHWARPDALLRADGRIAGVRFAYTEPGADGSLRDTGESFELAADMVFKAIGQALHDVPGLNSLVGRTGKIAVDGERRTGLDGVWAGGDCIAESEDLTVAAVQDGKIAAASIHAHLTANGG